MRITGSALAGLLLLVPCAAGAGTIQTEHRRIERKGESALLARVDFGGGGLKLHPGPADRVLEAEFTYDSRRVDVAVDYARKGAQGHLTIAGDVDHHGLASGRLTNDWDLGLCPDLPTELELDLGAAEARIDLGGLSVTRLDLEVGAAEAKVGWGEPNGARLARMAVACGASSLSLEGLGYARFERLTFEGGAGNFDVDLGGPWARSARADFEVGLGSLELRIPDDLAVRIEAESSFLSSVDVDRHFREVDDGVYETDGYDEADVRLELHLEVGMGSVEVDAYRP